MPHPATEMGRMLQPRGTVAVATSAVVAAAVNAPLMHPPGTPLRLHLSLSQAADSRANGWLLGPVPIRVPSGNPRPLVCQMPRLLCRWVSLRPAALGDVNVKTWLGSFLRLTSPWPCSSTASHSAYSFRPTAASISQPTAQPTDLRFNKRKPRQLLLSLSPWPPE